MQVVAHLTSGDAMITFALINSRLGWPWTYWDHGVLPGGGFVLICSLLVIGLCGIAAGEDDKGNFIFGVILWLVAGLVLQAMPAIDGGVQFVPLWPWCYAGWIARIVSSVVLLLIGVGCLVGVSHLQADRKQAIAIWCLAFGINALLSFATPAGVTPQNPTVTKWEKLRTDRLETLSKLRSDKDDLVARIRSLGAKDKRELMENPLGRTLMEEYEQLSQQIAATQREVDALDVAIERAKSRLRMTERKTNGLTEKEQDERSELDHQLELRHAPGHEVRIHKLLDEVLK